MVDMLEGKSGTRLPVGSGRSNSKKGHAFILLTLVLAASVLTLLSSVLLGIESRGDVNWAVVVSFLFNGAFACWALIRDAAVRPFSLVQVHWLFFLTFFVIAPLSQYAANYSCWGYPVSQTSYVTSNAILFIWAVFFLAFSTVGAKGATSSAGNAESFFYRLPQVSKGSVWVVLALSLVATSMLVSLVGFENLFSRSTFSLNLDKTQSLLLEKVLRCTPLFAFTFAFIRFKQSKDCFGALVLGAILLLLADFPFGMPRYNAAAVYGGLMLLCIPSFRRRKGLFPIVFLLLFLVVFPASNVFRLNEFDLDLFAMAIGRTFASFSEGFCSADYDAYSMLPRALDYVSVHGLTGGAQLLGALLFFVPRVVWPEKPQGSGATIVSAQGQAYTNISCPLPAEGIMNFGVIGLVAFAVLFGIACKRIDASSEMGGWAIFHPFLCFLFFFMLRGDLLSSFAYTTGFAVVYFATFLIAVPAPWFRGRDFNLSSQNLIKRHHQ